MSNRDTEEGLKRSFTRRHFIKLTSGALAFTLLSTTIGEQIAEVFGQSSGEQSALPPLDITETYDPRLVEQNTPMPESNYEPKWAMVIDVGACIGCRRCAYACRMENNIGEKIYPLWIEVFESDSDLPLTEFSDASWTSRYTDPPKAGKRYMPVQCMHCENPPCVKVCPVGARYKSEYGTVLTRYERCIGCRYCVVSCPYAANRFNFIKPEFNPARTLNPEVTIRPVGVVEKCTFCNHRVSKGLYPRCVEVCPVKARRFGNINDPESVVSKLLVSLPHTDLLEHLGTGPSIHYVNRGKKWGPDGERL